MSLTSANDTAIAAKPQVQLVSGRRLLLALFLMLLFAGGAGFLTWGIVHAVASAWTSTVDFVVLVVAESYAAVLAALLVAFGGASGAERRLGLRFTSGRDLGRALALDVVALLAAIALYVLFTPIFGPPLSIAIPVLKSVTDVTRLPN